MDPIEFKLHTTLVLLIYTAILTCISSSMDFQTTYTYLLENNYLLLSHVVILCTLFYMKPVFKRIFV
jgi:hypothetical protein